MDKSDFSMLSRVAAAIVGAVWACLEPTFPFLSLCLFAKCVDVVTAIRLNHRLHSRYAREIRVNPKARESRADGKIHSQHMTKVITDMIVVFLAVILAHWAGIVCPHTLGWLNPAECIAGGYAFIQLVSVLENEACCSDNKWARILQHWLVDKAERHVGVKVKELQNTKDELDSMEDEA